MIFNQIKKNNAAASYKTALLHFSAAAAATAIYALLHFFKTIDLLVLKRDHYNKETKMRKSRTTLIEITLMRQCEATSLLKIFLLFFVTKNLSAKTR